MSVRLSASTKLVGTINGIPSSFTASDLAQAAAAGLLYQYKIYETEDPDIECELVGIDSISSAGTEYTYHAKSESGKDLVLPRSSHVVNYNENVWSSKIVYHEAALINARYFVGKYINLKTSMKDRIIASTEFGGPESVYVIPGNLVLTSANALVIGL